MGEVQSIKRVILWNRVIRFAVGGFFMGTGLYYWKEGGWAAVLLGGVFVVTGLFRPRCCLGEGGCRVN